MLTHMRSLTGHPPVKPEDLKAPQRAGEKMSLWATIKFFFFLIPRLWPLFRNRPSVAIKRVMDVSDHPSLAIIRSKWLCC